MTKTKLKKDHAIAGAEVRMMEIGGRALRVAIWKSSEANKAALPLLFFNGIGANIELVAPFVEGLGGRDVVIFDMPGVGGSPSPTVPYNAITMSMTAAEVMDDLGYDKMDVMGVSWGGAMAQQFAMQYPGRVERLILAATTAGWMMVPGKLSALSKMANPRRYIDPSYMARNFEVLYGGKTDGSMGHVGRLKAPSKIGYVYQLLAMVGWTSAPLLPFLMRAKTLVIMGAEDNIVPAINGRFLNQLIPNSELEIVEGGGHLFLVSHAKESLARIRGFLDRPND